MAPAGTRPLAGAGCGAPIPGRLVLLPAPPSQAGTNRSASSHRAVTIPRALVWLWCGFGVPIGWLSVGFEVALVWLWWSLGGALGWLCGGFVLRSLCLVYAYYMALRWLWVALRGLWAWLSPPEPGGCRWFLRVDASPRRRRITC